MINIRNCIKSKIAESGFLLGQVVEELNKKYDRKDTIQNLSNKLVRGTIKYKEVLEIAEIIGYDIVWHKKNNTYK